ncbi:hypothetical protein OJ998_25085, partial [Solirubrobacter taibaiensis]|nr:hypothetical protein [Solirubrobacter taibaiensis]
AGGRGGRGPTTPDRAPEPEERRSGAGPLIAGLVALILLAGGGVYALANRGDEEPTQRAEQPTAEPTRESTPEPTPEDTATPEPTPEQTATPEATPADTPTPEPTPEETPEAPSGEPDLKAAQAAQLEGYNARQGGDFQTALTKAREAQQLCAGSKELSPCGYALFEEGVALIGLGQPEAAIAPLQRRLDEFGDNDSGEVRRALRDAKKAARGK